MNGFSERVEDILVNYSPKFLAVTKPHYFEDLTVEPTGHIHDNIHEDDPGMIEATFQHLRYHYNKERGL